MADRSRSSSDERYRCPSKQVRNAHGRAANSAADAPDEHELRHAAIADPSRGEARPYGLLSDLVNGRSTVRSVDWFVDPLHTARTVINSQYPPRALLALTLC